jgi:hypothetical protein
MELAVGVDCALIDIVPPSGTWMLAYTRVFTIMQKSEKPRFYRGFCTVCVCM